MFQDGESTAPYACRREAFAHDQTLRAAGARAPVRRCRKSPTTSFAQVAVPQIRIAGAASARDQGPGKHEAPEIRMGSIWRDRRPTGLTWQASYSSHRIVRVLGPG